MNPFLLMILSIVAGSVLSLAGGAAIFLTKSRRERAISIALPFGAGALLAAAFFDLMPEAFDAANPRELLVWVLVGFTAFFVMERTEGWFHHHHEHTLDVRNEQQNRMVMIGDLLHNMIDGVAIAAAFLANPATGIVTTIAVSAHEIPKELGTFGILLSRGWKDRKVLLANILTALGTLIVASIVYLFGSSIHLPLPQLLAVTSGIFIYIAASDIIPEIHEKPRREGTIQAAILVTGIVLVGAVVTLLGV